MNKFVMKADTPRDQLDWGSFSWLAHPPATKNKHLTVLDVELKSGLGHNFHRHPGQEEMIICVKGKVEQWVDQEMRILGPGDSVFIDANVVHASFNVGDGPASVIAILGPCVGEVGYEVEEVADQLPWKTLRA